ncbi:hypothetical protein BS17DRAFT_795730 [Gyrodon lividus]|nr:hypothetical protein BS17DRAFT_795730 [Gyrodon lividus]
MESNLPTAALSIIKTLLCAFAACHIGDLASNSIQNHIVALKAWHIYNNSTWKGTSFLNLSDHFDACCFTAACLAIWAQCCLGEILSTWEKSFQASKVVCQLHLLPPFNKNGSQKCHLPFTKVAKSKGEDVCICRQRDQSDPIAAIENHLAINPGPTSIPLAGAALLRKILAAT